MEGADSEEDELESVAGFAMEDTMVEFDPLLCDAPT